MRKAGLVVKKDGRKTVRRGKLDNGDKHWGMRSNKSFRKKLAGKEEME